MTSDSELKNLGYALKVTLGRMQAAGVAWGYAHYEHDDKQILFFIKPMVLCEDCQELSPADHCLWCEPDDFGGEGVA